MYIAVYNLLLTVSDTVLQDSSVHLQVQNKVDNDTAELMFDEYSFGNEHNITHIEIEPKSNVLFVLGKQV